jgi:hypothetical protein
LALALAQRNAAVDQSEADIFTYKKFNRKSMLTFAHLPNLKTDPFEWQICSWAIWRAFGEYPLADAIPFHQLKWPTTAPSRQHSYLHFG